MHGKKEVFIEGLEYTDVGKAKEHEADEFAIKWTLTPQQEQEVLASPSLTVEAIDDFAKKFTTLPALIIGRLAKKGIIHDSLGWTRGFYRKIVFE